MGSSFRVQTPFAAIQNRIFSTKEAIETHKTELAQAVGVTILSLNQIDYRALSRGGTASDGRRWKALDLEYAKRKASRGRGSNSRANKKNPISGKTIPVGNVTAIGIDTGLQFASGSPGFDAQGGGNVFKITHNGVTVGYGRSYSKFFDMARKLLPDTLPAAWRLMLNGIVGKWLETIIAGTIGKK